MTVVSKSKAGRLALVLLALFDFLIGPAALAQELALGLHGAPVLAFSQCGSRVYAALNSVKGIFYTDDWATWIYAGSMGSAYEYGTAAGVLCDGEQVFLIANDTLFVSPIASGPGHVWERIDLSKDGTITPGVPSSLAAAGDYLLVGTGGGEASGVLAIRGRDRQVLSYAFLSDVALGGVPSTDVFKSIYSIAFVPDEDESLGIMYALYGIKGSFGTQFITTKVEFGSPDGLPSIKPHWEPINLVGRIADIPPEQQKFGGIFNDGHGTLYVPTLGSDRNSAGIYYSLLGKYWDKASITFADSEFGVAEFHASSASFHGNLALIGNFLSADGKSFIELAPIPPQQDLWSSSDASTIPDNWHAVLIDQQNPSRAIASSPLGPYTTSGLGKGPASKWEKKTVGLVGIPVNDIAQDKMSPEIALFATANGILLSRDFNLATDGNPATTPTYLGPYFGTGGNFCTVELSQISASGLEAYAWTAKGVLKVTVPLGDSAQDPTGSLTPVEFLGSEGSVFHESSGWHVKNSILVGETLVSGFFNDLNGSGTLGIYSLDDQSAKLKLPGLPISALAGGQSGVLFAGVGGYKHPGEQISSADKRGVWRSLDGGDTWHKIEHPKLSTAAVPCMEYDSRNDILYVCANQVPIRNYCGFQSINTDPTVGHATGADTAIGEVVRVLNAGQPEYSVIDATIGLPASDPITALTVATYDKSYRVFAASGHEIYESDQGKTWSRYYAGEPGQEMGKLYYDDLVIGSNIGLSGVSSEQRSVFIMSDLTSTLRRGTLDTLTVRFNREVDDLPANVAKLKAKLRHGTRELEMELAKKTARVYELRPSKPWYGTDLKLSIGAGFQAARDIDTVPDIFDSDFNSIPDGLEFTIPIALEGEDAVVDDPGVDDPGTGIEEPGRTDKKKHKRKKAGKRRKRR